ncbi:Ribonuclease D [hydrothermal vent metagenome]|uniref:Ribonuclease D n=1 Tax=hydrothermal vent metagenome TaxID=652676 RepID=A0A3B1AQR4_9ZZZZ
MMTDELYIKTDEQLDAFCTQIKNSPYIAIDTEFMREKTYYPQLCLIQIATEDHIACIDPLVIKDLKPLWAILYDENIIKIFHAARQDLELIYNLTQNIPKPIFDTQIAATLLGLGDQIGYATLVKSMLNIDLDKSQTRTDWSQRPLDKEQIKYAANDVKYLVKCYGLVRSQLNDKNRLDWLDKDFEQLSNSNLYDVDVQQTWMKVSGKQKLKGNALGVLRTLSAWREKTAQEKDLPKKWVMKDDILIGLAMKRPKNTVQLAKIRGLTTDTISRNGNTILNLINETEHQTPERLNTPGKLNQEQDALIDSLMAVMRFRASQENISPAMIANRKDLEQLLIEQNNTELAITQGWRKAVAGDSIVDFLNGKIQLIVKDGKLTIAN